MITTRIYLLGLEERQDLLLPEGAQILCIEYHSSQIRLYALIDDSKILTPRIIKMYRNGTPIPQIDRYIGSFRYGEDLFFLHFFEELHSVEDSEI